MAEKATQADVMLRLLLVSRYHVKPKLFVDTPGVREMCKLLSLGTPYFTFRDWCCSCGEDRAAGVFHRALILSVYFRCSVPL